MKRTVFVHPNRLARATFLAGAAALAVTLASAAQAQTTAKPADEKAADNSVEALEAADKSEIVVTGTSIRGVAPIGSPLIGVDQEFVKVNAPANMSELLSLVPQLGNFGVNHEIATTGRFRTGGFLPNIHNIGIFATLALFNGHRMAAVGGEAVLPDPGIVPVLGIGRVEVVADGSSAVYGSDAVAGVANFVYRRDMDSFEAQATYGFSPEHSFEKRNFGLGWGKKWSTGNVMIVSEYSSNKSPFNSEIPFLRADQRFRGGRDQRTTSCDLPNVTIGSTVYAYPSFAVGSANRNRCENQLNTQLVPESTRYSLLGTFRQELNDTITVWAEGNYSKLDTERVANPRVMNITVPGNNPYLVLPPGVTLAPGQTVAVNRNGEGLFPNPLNVQSSEVIGVTLGADVKLGGGWLMNVMTHYSKTNDYNSQPEIDLVAAQNLANGTTLATAFNPFGQAGQNNPAVLAQINNGFTQINDSSQYLRQLMVKADGPLFALGGGDARLAVGSEFRDEQAKQLQIGGVPGPQQLLVRNDNISRFVAAVYSEINLPFFTSKNARPGLERLELSVSGRFDHYQKLGGTFNPKVGLVWAPLQDISLRGSWSTSFVAPNLGLITSIFGVPQIGLNIAGFGNNVNIYNQGGGNPALTPEEAETYSIGADIKPSFIPGLKLSATYYNVKYKNLIYKPTQADAFNNPFFSFAVVRNPTAAQVTAAIAAAPPQSPVPARIDAIFQSFAINVGQRIIDGLDLDLTYKLPTNFGDWTLNVNANRQIGFRQELAPGTGFQDIIGQQSAIKWRGRGQLSWSKGDLTVSGFMTYVGGFTNITTGTPFPNVKSWETFDLTVQYNLPNLLKGSQIQLRGSNIFNRWPPFYDGTLGFFQNAHSPYGRSLEITLRTKF
ncbi:TonB-dependent receptor [Novosphingobium sp.]|uniref:TonB-dependent receptor domain-containing protein n=1 Tax=Novosphingobium sp. TaxID=1874826 RepID=UPI002609B32B|nr:TonB-dependent receptor [Novosphingobium sp.]